MRKDAVTLIELLIVIVIVGILAAIAVPIYTNKVERTRGERAIANIELIASAMKMYQIKHGDLFHCSDNSDYLAAFPNPGDPNTNMLTDPDPINPPNNYINNNLNLDLSDDYFYYNINFDGSYYDIEVIRISGTYKLDYCFYPPGNQEGWYNCPDKWPWYPTQPAF